MPGVIDTNLYRNLRRVFLGSAAWTTLRNKLRLYWVTPPRGATIRWDAEDINGAMTWMLMPEGRDYWSELFELQNQIEYALRRNDRPLLQQLRERVVEPLDEASMQARREEAARRDAEFREQLQTAAEVRRMRQAQQEEERMKKYAKVYD